MKNTAIIPNETLRVFWVLFSKQCTALTACTVTRSLHGGKPAVFLRKLDFKRCLFHLFSTTILQFQKISFPRHICILLLLNRRVFARLQCVRYKKSRLVRPLTLRGKLININYANPLSHSANCDILQPLPLFRSPRLGTRQKTGSSFPSPAPSPDCDYSRRLCLQLAAKATRLLLLLLLLLVTNAAPYGGTMTHIMRRFY